MNWRISLQYEQIELLQIILEPSTLTNNYKRNTSSEYK